MQSEQAIEFGQEAIMTCLTLVAPILIVGIVIAILMGLSLIHISEPTRPY